MIFLERRNLSLYFFGRNPGKIGWRVGMRAKGDVVTAHLTHFFPGQRSRVCEVVGCILM